MTDFGGQGSGRGRSGREPVPELTIAFSTLADRIGNIALPDPAPGVEILVLVQGGLPHQKAAHLSRPDVRIVDVAGRGVARSRNRALAEAAGTALLFADDDTLLDEAGISSALNLLRVRPEIALLLGRCATPDGSLRKRYARGMTRLTRFNSARAGTTEIMVRPRLVRETGVRFDEAFGAGQPNFLGDEYIFITDLLRAGLSCWSVPEIFSVHPAESSGLGWRGPASLRSRRAVLKRVFPRLWPVMLMALLIKNAGRLAR